MKAPQPLQFRSADLPDVDQSVLSALNTFLRQVGGGLSNQLTLSQNAAATIRTQEVTTAGIWTFADPLLNGWVAFGGLPPRYTKFQDGRVLFSGALTTGTIGLIAFQLPEAYWPEQDVNMPATSNGAYGEAMIDAAGNVTPNVGSNVFFSLDGVGYPAADTSPVSNLPAPLTFAHNLEGRCTDLVLTYAREKTNGTPVLVAAVTTDWHDNGDGTVTVRNMGGLAYSTTYTCRFLCLSDPA